MNAFRVVARETCRAALLAAALVPVTRAEDDVVKEDEPTPPPAQAPQFGGPMQNGRVIIMPGVRLQLGGQNGFGQVQAPGANAVRKEAFLGVVATPVPPAVRAQLDLPEGVGLSINLVAAGGPAEKAGVKQFDVIHKFNDQVVCAPEQLTTLVKVAGAGTTVPLTLVRGGRERVVEAVLEEHEVAGNAAGEAIVNAMPGVLNLQQWGPQPVVPQQLIPQGGAAGIDPQVQADIEKRLAEALARAGAGGGILPGFPPGMPGFMPPLPAPPAMAPNVRAQVLAVGPNAQSVTAVSDARGTVEIRSAGGKKTVTVKDRTGTELYSGALDTDEDMENVPEDYREWVRGVRDGGPQVVQPRVPEAEEPGLEPQPAEAEASGPTT